MTNFDEKKDNFGN